MKFTYTFILVCSSFYCLGQSNLTGIYSDAFGNRIELFEDSTFNYKWRFDLASSWTKGTWTASNDTIYFTARFVYDTVSINDQDSLFLSMDTIPERVNYQNFTFSQLPSGGQNKHPIADKLYYRNEKLWVILPNGKIQRAKIRGGITNEKFHSWYKKRE